MTTTRDLTEALLTAKLHLVPEVAGDKLYFLSDSSGRMSLYAMPVAGGEKVQLIPDEIALPNPKLVGSTVLAVLPQLGKIVLAMDTDGDENYRPHVVPIEGGTPEPLWPDRFAGQQVFMNVDRSAALGLMTVAPRDEPIYRSYIADLATGELTEMASSPYGAFIVGHDAGYDRVAMIDAYTMGDTTLYLWERATGERRLLAGVPITDREGAVAPSGFGAAHVTDDGVLIISALFEDTGGLALVPLDGGDPAQVDIIGIEHTGVGELTGLTHLDGSRYLLDYNIDGVSWGYEAEFDPVTLTVRAVTTVYGTGDLGEGVVEASNRNAVSGTWALAFSSADFAGAALHDRRRRRRPTDRRADRGARSEDAVRRRRTPPTSHTTERECRHGSTYRPRPPVMRVLSR